MVKTWIGAVPKWWPPCDCCTHRHPLCSLANWQRNGCLRSPNIQPQAPHNDDYRPLAAQRVVTAHPVDPANDTRLNQDPANDIPVAIPCAQHNTDGPIRTAAIFV